MNVRPKGIVTLPRPTSRKMDILPWSRDVNRALQQLRDRVFTTYGSRGGGGGATPGAFYRTRTVASEDATNGDIYLQGGTVSGLATPVPDILLYDASETAWEGTAGQNLQLKITVDGSESSGIPNPGVTPTGTPVVTSETTLGTNTYPAGTGDMTGKLCHISLGAFFDGGFTPAGLGNINVGWCFGNAYTITRE